MTIAEPGSSTGSPDAVPASGADSPPPPPRRVFPNTFAALSNNNFRLLLAGNTLSFASGQMQNLVRGVLAYQITESFVALGLLHLAQSTSGFIFTPLGGVIADRVPKKTVIQSIQIFNMLNAFALALLAWAGMLGYEHLVITTALAGAVNNVMTASRHTIIADMVGRDKLMNGIALNSSVQNLMQLIGPGLGGLLIAFVNATIAFVVMGVLYAGAVLFTVQLPSKPFDAVEGAASAVKRSNGFRDLIDGFKYVARDMTIRTHILVNFGIVMLATPYSNLLPGFVDQVLGKGPAEQGVLMGVSGFGALVGTLLIASMPPRRRGRLLIAIGMVLAIALVAFSISTNYYVTLVIMMFIGAGISMRMAVGQVILQTYSDEAYRGRTVSVWMTQYSIVSFGTFGVSFLAEWFGAQWAIGSMAGLLALVMVYVWLFVPRMRHLD